MATRRCGRPPFALHYERERTWPQFESKSSCEWPLFFAYEFGPTGPACRSAVEEAWGLAADGWRRLSLEVDGLRSFRALPWCLRGDRAERAPAGARRGIRQCNVSPALGTPEPHLACDLLLNGLIKPDRHRSHLAVPPEQPGAEQVLVALAPANASIGRRLEAGGPAGERRRAA